MAQVKRESLKRRVLEALRALVARPATVGVAVCVVGLVAIAAILGVGAAGTRTTIIADASQEEPAGDEAAVAEDASDAAGADASAASQAASIVVDVSGAVLAPAVVTLPEGARVQDAIEAAGGLAADADLSALNRAAPVADGAKVIVPRVGEQTEPASASGAATAAEPSASTSAAASPLVNINTATAAELDELPGVGPSTAQAIIEDRTRQGPFTAPEDLMRVSGIGEKKFEKLRGLICV